MITITVSTDDAGELVELKNALRSFKAGASIEVDPEDAEGFEGKLVEVLRRWEELNC